MLHAVLTTVLAATVLSPPSGRPPIGPLDRYEPKLYDIKFEVSLLGSAEVINMNGPFSDGSAVFRRRMDFTLQDAPIVLPLIMQGTYSTLDRTSFKAHLYLNAREDKGFNGRSRLEESLPFHQQMAVMPTNPDSQFVGSDLRWNFSFRTQVWNSRIDEAAAQRITWPREWPEEVQDALKPQMYIESDNPIFKQTVQRVAGDQLRMVPPYLAAKDLIRYTINELRINGDGLYFGGQRELFGMQLVGALKAAQDGIGSPHDLVCICVAILRAAGIPARPVIGVYEDQHNRDVFVSWAEFYLPDAGWIPFDPNEMRGKGIRHLDVRAAWPEFGSLDELNERIPIAHNFVPPASVESPMCPAIWGWDPRPGGTISAWQTINIDIVSRGRGKEDDN